MKSVAEWHRLIAAESCLPSDAALQLRDTGFVILPGPPINELSTAYDRAVLAADPADIHVGRTGATTRINDFVNRSAGFDSIYVHPPLLAACCQIIGRPFKLSGMRGRTLNPGAANEQLHVDVRREAGSWPLVGCILMVDAFDVRNGATRFVPGSHLLASGPDEVRHGAREFSRQEIPACGPAGSMIIFNASVWHGHGANKSEKPRRSIQLHFTPRDGQSAPDDHAKGMHPKTLQRIGDLAKYVLDVVDTQSPDH